MQFTMHPVDMSNVPESPHRREPLLSTTDLAAELGIPEATLANWRSQRVGPGFLRVGRHVRYRRVDVDRWIEQQARATSIA
jgi:excisionase family DNA binding protein